MGTGTALCAFLIGRQIFNASVGVLACAVVAVYPYYVMHDTALQETGLATFCTALSVWLLIRANNQHRDRDYLFAGLGLGSIVLVRASLAPAAVMGLLWTAMWGAQGNGSRRLSKCSIVLLGTLILVGPWLFRNFQLTGAPVLSSEVGHALWVGNNPETFSHYPAESIDRSMDAAESKLTEEDHAELMRLADDEVATSNWFTHRAFAFIRANPWAVAQGALRKLGAAFSPILNPERDSLTQAIYVIGYVPVAIFGVFGMFLARKKHDVILIGMLYLAFIGVTAVYWAHTRVKTH